MDHAQILVRSVARTFYNTEQIVIIDALVTHSALQLTELSAVLDMKVTKIVQKHCGGLKEAGLISVYSRQEQREGAQKAITREYYYIDYRRAIDAIKYRIHMLDSKVKQQTAPRTEKKELSCPQCAAQWTYLEVFDMVDPNSPSGFSCPKCGHALDALTTKDEPEKDDTPAMFNKQFDKILMLLQQIDQSTVPEVTGEQAVADARPLPKEDASGLPLIKREMAPEQIARPEAVKGISTGPEKIEISLTTNSESTAAQYRAEQEHKAKVALANALPEWYTKSTVTGEATALGHRADEARRENEVNGISRSFDDFDDDKKIVKDRATEMEDAYFKALEEERQREDQRQAEEEEEEDEDDDDFEDVTFSAPIPVGDEPDAKRVKVEDVTRASSATNGTPAASGTPSGPQSGDANGNDGGAEESDEDDFEDAL